MYCDDVPNFISKYRDLHGKCRRGVEGCKDCRRTDLSSVRNIHFTNCCKPWNCAGKLSTGKGDINPRTADYDHCMQGKILSPCHRHGGGRGIGLDVLMMGKMDAMMTRIFGGKGKLGGADGGRLFLLSYVSFAKMVIHLSSSQISCSA